MRLTSVAGMHMTSLTTVLALLFCRPFKGFEKCARLFEDLDIEGTKARVRSIRPDMSGKMLLLARRVTPFATSPSALQQHQLSGVYKKRRPHPMHAVAGGVQTHNQEHLTSLKFLCVSVFFAPINTVWCKYAWPPFLGCWDW